MCTHAYNHCLHGCFYTQHYEWVQAALKSAILLLLHHIKVLYCNCSCMQAYLQCCNDILLSITVIPITWSDIAIEEEWLQFRQLFA